jgi:hypothetical protein
VWMTKPSSRSFAFTCPRPARPSCSPRTCRPRAADTYGAVWPAACSGVGRSSEPPVRIHMTS